MRDAAAPFAIDASTIRDRLERLCERIASAGGDVSRVRVLAVSKTFPATAVVAARRAGLFEFGENYADELVEKAVALAEDDQIRWHFIGNIQRNKLARLAPHTAVYEAVTRPTEATEIARRARGSQIFVEVDATGIPGRPGVAPDRVADLVAELRAIDVDVRGLMTVAAPGGGHAASTVFALVKKLAEDLSLPECSMGMSDDLEEAVREGSTEVRVGTALFGPRDVRG